MTVGYLDGSALAASLSPGYVGDRVASVWSSFDAACTSQFTEVEVPSQIGRHLDRVAWVWAVNSLAIVGMSDDLHHTAVDLAWLGAPPNVALHIAAARTTEVDHFVTVDAVAASWAEMQGLNVVKI